MQRHYSKHYMPLESTPEIFNQLLTWLGAAPCLSFQDVFSLTEPSQLPGPAIALVLVFPTTDQYENRKAFEEASLDARSTSDDQIIWFPQTINNACGLYAILHALSNGVGRTLLSKCTYSWANVAINALKLTIEYLLPVIGPDSWLANLLTTSSHMSPDERSSLIENSMELEEVYAAIACQGTSHQPESAEEELDFHYICLVRSQVNGHLYELDGDRTGPIDKGDAIGQTEDLLEEAALEVVREYFEADPGSIGFSLMALVVQQDLT